MEVCLEEIERCQRLSPKPNFILLLGQRYGWIPLPSKISEKDFQSLLENAAPEISKILNKAYRLDLNLTVPAYILLPPIDILEDDEDYETSIAEPLRKHIASILPELMHSATEHEIIKGVYESQGSAEHIIAYFRKFYFVPRKIKSTYIQNPKATARIKRQLDKLGVRHLLKERLFYCKYPYNSDFETFMETHISQIIENEIKHYDSLEISENERHLDFAQRASTEFYGRKKELEELKEYVYSPNISGKILLINESKDRGVTSLLAKLAADIHSNGINKVIARFCDNVDCGSALNFVKKLFEEIQELNYDEKRRINFQNWYWNFGLKFASDSFIQGLNNIPPSRDTLIVIDNIASIESVTYEGGILRNINRLFGYDKLPENVKIIISFNKESTHNVVDKTYCTFFRIPNLVDELEELTKDYLHKNERKLSEKQQLDWINTIRFFSPLYAKSSALLLAIDNLKNIASWNKGYALNIENQTPYIVSNFIKPTIRKGEVPETLLVSTLKLLASSSIGVPEELLLQALHTLPEIQAYLQKLENSQWGLREKRIPPMIWSRLTSVLSPIICFKPTVCGTTMAFRNSSIQTSIKAYYGISAHVLFDLIKDNYHGNKWALYEFPQLMQSMADTAHSNDEKISVLEELESHINDLDYLGNKKLTFDHLIAEDFNTYTKIHAELGMLDSDDKTKRLRRAQSIKTELLHLPQPVSMDHFFALVAGLGSQSEVYPLLMSYIEKKGGCNSSYLIDVMNCGNDSNRIKAYTGEIGQFPVHSKNADRLAFIEFDKLVIRNLLTGEEQRIEISPELSGIYNLVANPQLTQFVIIYEGFSYFCTIDSYSKANISPLLEGTEQWANFSPDGNKLIMGGKDILTRIYFGADGVVDISGEKATSSKCSENGIFTAGHLWEIYNTREFAVCQADNLHTIYTFTASKNSKLIAADDYRALLELEKINTTRNFFILNYKSKFNYSFNISEEGSPISSILLTDEDDLMIFKDNGTWMKLTNATSENRKWSSGSSFQVESSRFGLQNLLSRYGKIIFDFNPNGTHYVKTNAGLNGINTLATDKSGETIAATFGKNFLQESYSHFPLYIQEEQTYKCKMIDANTLQYPSTCAISADGKYYAFATCFIYIVETTTGIVHSKIMQNSITHMKFTQDNRLIAVTGDYIADATPECFVYNLNGEVLQHITSEFEEFGLMRMEFLLSPDERYVILDQSGMFDLKKEIFISGEKFIGPLTMRKDDTFLLADQFPFGAFSRDSRYFYSANDKGELCRTDLERLDVEVIGKAALVYTSVPNSNKLYCCNLDASLSIFDLESKTHTNLPLSKIFKVFPCADCRHLYLVTFDSEILYTTTEGKILSRAACKGERFTLCDKGLVVATDEGKISLFSPTDVIKKS